MPPLDDLLRMAQGSVRTAALAAWFQGLYGETREVPVLVGGAAVELYTGGAYQTGDLDFVGEVPEGVAERLEENGFARRGRHWVHESGNLYIELPGLDLGPDELPAIIEVGHWKVRIVSLEDILVDRLAGWTFWRSHVHGINAYLLFSTQGDRLEMDRLRARSTKEGVERGLESLKEFDRQLGGREPSSQELAEWAKRFPRDVS